MQAAGFPKHNLARCGAANQDGSLEWMLPASLLKVYKVLVINASY